MKLKKRSMWLVLGAVLLAGVLVARVAVALDGANRMPENPLGLTGLDALILSFLLAPVILLPVMHWVTNSAHRLLARMRRQFPGADMYLVSVLPSSLELIQELGSAPKLKENTAAALLMSERQLSWWRGVRRPAQLASVVSDVPITYKVGVLNHYLSTYPALVAVVTIRGISHDLPVLILSEVDRGWVFKAPKAEELAAIQSKLLRL